MSIANSLSVSIFGIILVFVVLIGLILILRLQSALITSFTQKKSDKKPVRKARIKAAPKAKNGMSDELIAVITAAVQAYSAKETHPLIRNVASTDKEAVATSDVNPTIRSGRN